jgi:hypothetical protein
MDNIPTAKEFFLSESKRLNSDPEDMPEWMFESAKQFAKLYLKTALDKIYEESKHGDKEHQDWLKAKFDSYDLNQIK